MNTSNKINEAVILAGGFGTRLKDVINDVPKPMAPIADQPFLNYIFSYLKHYKIERIVLSVGYLHEKIKDYYKHNFNGIEVEYATELEPLGTGGGIRLSLEKCLSNNILILNGDSFFDVNLDEYSEFHFKNQSQVSLALRKVDDAARYGTIELAGDRITTFKEKDNQAIPGVINGGVYLLNKKTYLDLTPEGKAFSIEKDFFEIQTQKLAINGKLFNDYFIDIGIPTDYHRANEEFKRFKY